MRTSRLILTATAVAALVAATVTTAQARHRHAEAYVDVSVGAACGPSVPATLRIYPAADWNPFFHHHYYRYGPIELGCEAPVETTNVVSVRY